MHVLIIGGGIGGLVLAQLLRKQKVPFTVYERSVVSHPQGWAIALHGILPELVAALPEDLPPLAETVNHLRALGVGPELCMYQDGNRDARMAFQDDGSGTSLVRANRKLLRDYLETNIDVQYGKKAVSAEQDGDVVTVRFADGTTAQGDIVIGADGVHSAVRKSILEGKDLLKTVPVASITGELQLSGEALKRQLALGRSACIVKPPRPNTEGMLFVGTNIVHEGGDSADMYWVLMWPLEAAGTNEGRDAWTHKASREEQLAFAVAESRLMDPELSEIVRLTEAKGIFVPPVVFNSLELPSLPASRMTLLGDAAHCMPPFRGEGGVNAIVDAVRLGQAIDKIVTQGVQIEQAMAEYHKEMLERGNVAVRASVAAMNTSISQMSGILAGPAKSSDQIAVN